MAWTAFVLDNQVIAKFKHGASTRVGLLALLAALVVSCGVQPTPSFPNALTDSSGRVILLDEVEAIVNDPNPNLDDDDRRQSLRDLGIEDEKLIDALLDL